MKQTQPALRLLGVAGFCALLALSGCPGSGQPRTKASTATTKPAGGIKVTLVCTDLGLEDGYFVRDAYAALKELEQSGKVALSLAGRLPEELSAEANRGDVGLPDSTVSEGAEKLSLSGVDPGRMTEAQGIALLDEVVDAEALVLSSPTLVQPAQERIAAGKLHARCILLLDENAWLDKDAACQGPAPVLAFRYDALQAGFLAGVAAAVSSNNAKFITLGSSADPDANDWIEGAYAGAKYQSNGASMVTGVLQAGADGLLSPDEYRDGMAIVRQTAGPDFAVNHYIAALGRATPSILYALSSAPTDGFVAGGYGDFRRVRPARFIGCSVKKPGAALRWLFAQPADGGFSGYIDDAENEPADALPLFKEVKLGIEDGVIGFTDMDLYSRSNRDGDDIGKAVSDALALLEAGEINIAELQEQQRRALSQ